VGVGVSPRQKPPAEAGGMTLPITHDADAPPRQKPPAEAGGMTRGKRQWDAAFFGHFGLPAPHGDGYHWKMQGIDCKDDRFRKIHEAPA